VIRRNLPAAVVIGLVSALAAQPLFGCLPRGHDSLLHLYRLVELDHLLHQGILFPRWMPDLVYGYGYPLFNFYAPLSTYLSEVIHLITGFGFQHSVAAAFGVCVLIGATGMYCFARDYLDVGPALFGAAAYVLAPYPLYNAYIRGSLSDALAIALFPWVAWTFRRAVRDGGGYVVAAALTYAALILSHNVSSLAFTPLLVLYLIANLLLPPPPLREGRARLLRGLIAPGLGLALGAFFWLPALAERGITQLDAFISSPDYDFHNYFLTLRELIALPGPARTGLLNPSPPRSLGPLLVALALIGLVGAFRRRGRGEAAATVLVFGAALVGLGFMMLPPSAGLWEQLPLVRYFQFPWRLLAPASFVTAFLAAAGLAQVVAVLPGAKRAEAAKKTINLPVSSALFLAALGIGFLSLPYLYPYQPCDLPASPGLADVTAYQQDWGTLGVTSAGEYLPVWVRQPPTGVPFPGADLGAPLSAKLDNGKLPPEMQVLASAGGPTWARLRLFLPEARQIAFHVFDFPGWEAQIDGQPAAITPEPPLGRISLTLPAGEHQLDLHFGNTPPRRIGEWMSLAGLIACLLVGAASLRSTLRTSSRPLASTSGGEKVVGGKVLPLALAAASLLLVKAAWIDHADSPFRLAFDGHTAPAVLSPPASNFEGEFALLGYRLSSTRVQSGERLEVILYWRAQRWLSQNYDSYAHLIDPGFKMYAQDDNRLFDYAPTRLWNPAGYVEDRHELDVPPTSAAGKYWIEVGVYTSDQRRRLSVLDSAGQPLGDQLLLAPVKILDSVRRAPSPSRPMDVTFGGSARLLGYDLATTQDERRTTNTPPSSFVVRPSSTLQVILYWQALTHLDRDYTVFVHLLDSTGRLVAQHDAQPRGGYFPTTYWDPGEFITDEHALEIPASLAPGGYTLTIGLYDLETGERMVVRAAQESSQDGEVKLGQVIVASPN
jgi:hypothetical protein